MGAPKSAGSSRSALLVMETTARSLHRSRQSCTTCILCGCLKRYSAEKSWLLILWFPLQGFTGINSAGHRAAVARCGAKGIAETGLCLFTLVSLFSPFSFCCLHSWRHTLHTEIMLGKFCHIVLPHPMRKLAFPWTSVFHSQLDKQEPVGSGAEGSYLSYGVSHF